MWIELLTGGGAVALLGFLRFLIRRRDRNDAESAAHMVADIYRSLTAIVATTKANRALVLRTSNGGGIPRVGSPLYSTAIYEVFNDATEPVSGAWEKQYLDRGYVSLVSDLLREGRVRVMTKELPPGSILRDTYESLRVEFSDVFLLYQSRASIYYLSVDYGSLAETSAADRDKVRSEVNRIRRIFNEAKP